MIKIGFLAILACSMAPVAQAVDVSSLWVSGDPSASEQRLRKALVSAEGDYALILYTQIARTYVFRRKFSEARNELKSIELNVESAGPEGQIRYWLELGRTYASHQHPPETQSPAAKQNARQAYQLARDLAARANLDGLEIDATHMFAFVDTAPADQLKWGLESLALIEESDQLEAKKWEASIQNNVGEALYDLSRYAEALPHFERALVLRKQESNWLASLNAEWHIARIFRKLGRTEDALKIQIRLEQENAIAGNPRPYIFEELEILYRLMGNEEREKHYSQRRLLLSQ